MRKRSLASAWVAALIAAPVLLLGGCVQTTGPLFRPDSPRDGAGNVVDPVYGTPIPGSNLGYGRD
jgi:hypothetical protein